MPTVLIVDDHPSFRATARALLEAEGFVVVLFRRWRVASAPSRRVLVPVFLTGGAAGLLLVFNLIIVEFSEGAADVAWWLILVALSSVPLAFLAGLVRGRLARAAVERLFVTERAVEKHVTSIFGKLRLPVAPEDHRRVLAVLALLRS